VRVCVCVHAYMRVRICVPICVKKVVRFYLACPFTAYIMQDDQLANAKCHHKI